MQPPGRLHQVVSTGWHPVLDHQPKVQHHLQTLWWLGRNFRRTWVERPLFWAHPKLKLLFCSGRVQLLGRLVRGEEPLFRGGQHERIAKGWKVPLLLEEPRRRPLHRCLHHGRVQHAEDAWAKSGASTNHAGESGGGAAGLPAAAELQRRLGQHGQLGRRRLRQRDAYHRNVVPWRGQVQTDGLRLQGTARNQIHDGATHCRWMVNFNI